MTGIYFTCFLMWVFIGIFYFYMKWRKHLDNKGKKNGVVYITRNIYLKLHNDGVIFSLYTGKKEIADDILEFNNGIFKTVFKTIFGTISLNRFTKKFVIDENKEA